MDVESTSASANRWASESMTLRAQFNFPTLDEAKVNRLAELADELDGAAPGQCDDELQEFNDLAGTQIPLAEFQGIYGGMSHASWVRNVLCEPFVDATTRPTNDEALEIINRLTSGTREEWEQFFWIRVLERHLDPRVSDLIYWPGEYFGDGDNSREMSPQEILDVALESKERAIRLPDTRSP